MDLVDLLVQLEHKEILDVMDKQDLLEVMETRVHLDQ